MHYAALQAIGSKLTKAIGEADARHDQKAVDELLERKTALIREMAKHVHITSDRPVITSQSGI